MKRLLSFGLFLYDPSICRRESSNKAAKKTSLVDEGSRNQNRKMRGMHERRGVERAAGGNESGEAARDESREVDSTLKPPVRTSKIA